MTMKVTGHKTRSVFDRYHIVWLAALQDIARRLTGTFSGTATPAAIAHRAVTSDNSSARL